MLDKLDQLTHVVLFSIGGTPVSLSSIVAALVILIMTTFVARFAGLGLRRIRNNATSGRGMLYLLEKLITYSVVLIGLVSALSSIGLNLSAFAVFAGAFGIGIGFGFQGVIKEFVSGLVLIFDRQFNVGDFIELDSGRRGTVQEIGPRATRIRTNDNVYLLLPNSALIDNVVINWTLRDAVRRIHVAFPVAYGSDKAKVREAALKAAASVPFTLPDEGDRKTQVWLVGFGESSFKFELVVWPTLEACKRPAAMQAAYAWAIDDALREAGIEIPFPQRELRVRSMFGREDDDAVSTLGLHRRTPEPVAPQQKSQSVNDAADDLQRPPEKSERLPTSAEET